MLGRALWRAEPVGLCTYQEGDLLTDWFRCSRGWEISKGHLHTGDAQNLVVAQSQIWLPQRPQSRVKAWKFPGHKWYVVYVGSMKCFSTCGFEHLWGSQQISCISDIYNMPHNCCKITVSKQQQK